MFIAGFTPTVSPRINRAKPGFITSKESGSPATQDSVTLTSAPASASSANAGPFRRALKIAAPIGLWTLPAALGAIGGPAGAAVAGLAAGAFGYVASSQSPSNYNPSLDLWSGVLGAGIGGGLGGLGAQFGLTAVAGVVAVATLCSLSDL